MSKLSKEIQKVISNHSAQEASEIIAKMIENPKKPYCQSAISCCYKNSHGLCTTKELCPARVFS